MIGTLISIIFALIVLGVLWWALQQLLALIPFAGTVQNRDLCSLRADHGADRAVDHLRPAGHGGHPCHAVWLRQQGHHGADR